MEPSLLPLQVGGVITSPNASEAGWSIKNPAEAVHPFTSVTVTLYAPKDNPEISSVFVLFDHWKVNGAVPPATVRSIEPSLLPKQAASVTTPLRDGLVINSSVITMLSQFAAEVSVSV